MTLPTLNPLSAEERAAWAAHNLAEENARYAQFQSLSFREKLEILERRGQELSRLRDSAKARLAAARK